MTISSGWPVLILVGIGLFSSVFYLYAKNYGALPEGIFWQDKNIKIFWTHLIRDISKIHQFKDCEYYDITTPYGYGGPLVAAKTTDKEIIKKSLENFFKEYSEYAFKEKFVCEFIRFHPVFGNWEPFREIFKIDYLNDVVVVDLSQNLEKIWDGIKKGHKYNIKKTVKEGCEVKIINKPTEADMGNFIKTYYRTMDKNQASEKYYFPGNFIKAHFKSLNAILMEARYKNKIIGSSIFIWGDKIVHYFLSGTGEGSRGLYPSNLILWEAIKWAKGKNFDMLNLGGGRGENDSLFEFKKGFSAITMPFKIGKIIFDQDIYDKLGKINIKTAPGSYFPKYRYGLNETII